MVNNAVAFEARSRYAWGRNGRPFPAGCALPAKPAPRAASPWVWCRRAKSRAVSQHSARQGRLWSGHLKLFSSASVSNRFRHHIVLYCLTLIIVDIYLIALYFYV